GSADTYAAAPTTPPANLVTPLRLGEGPGEGSYPSANFHISFCNGQFAISGDPWQRIRVPASDCPRIDAAFLHQERRSLGDWWFSQEYECQLNDTDDQVFATEHINAALDDTTEPLNLDL